MTGRSKKQVDGSEKLAGMKSEQAEAQRWGVGAKVSGQENKTSEWAH